MNSIDTGCDCIYYYIMNRKKTLTILIFIIAISFLYIQKAGAEEDRLDVPSTSGINTRFINIRALMLYGTGKFDVYSKVYDVDNYGFKLDMYYGKKIPVIPGLEISLGASFLVAGNDVLIVQDNTFDIDVDPSELVTVNQECTMGTSLFGTLAGLRFGFSVKLFVIKAGVEVGTGVCFLYERNDWDVDRQDTAPDAFDADLERNNVIKPFLDIGIRLSYCVDEHNQIGLFGGLFFIPCTIEIATPYPVTLSPEYGPYTISTFVQGGLFWQVSL
jgi:hypothetical protein